MWLPVAVAMPTPQKLPTTSAYTDIRCEEGTPVAPTGMPSTHLQEHQLHRLRRHKHGAQHVGASPLDDRPRLQKVFIERGAGQAYAGAATATATASGASEGDPP